MKKIHTLDQMTGLKGIFCIVIMLGHTLPSTPLIDKIPLTSFILQYGGDIGNAMFFMLSGFLMTYGYRDRIRLHEISIKDFLVRRLYKLYPLYLVTNIAAFIHGMFAYGLSNFNLQRIVFTLLLQSGGSLGREHPYNGPAWFICALFECYLLFYFIAYHAKHRTQYFCMIVFSIIWGYSTLVNNGPLFPICIGQGGNNFQDFFIGCALAELYPVIREQTKKWLKPVSFLFLATSGILLLTVGVEIISGNVNTAFAFVLCPLIIYLSLDSVLIRRILTLRPIRYIGQISFSIYLWHTVIYDYYLYIYREFLGGQQMGDLQYLFYLMIMFAVSALSHKYIEGRKRKTA